MVLLTGYTVTSVIHAGFRQLLGPDHRKCEGPIVTREMGPGNHTSRHDWDVAATRRCNQSAI
jgi:hypothetical protein